MTRVDPDTAPETGTGPAVGGEVDGASVDDATVDQDIEAAVEVDGRTARRDRNRLAVLDAVVELFSEDDLDPSPEDVARRSGVSMRSVYRYFSDPEELLRAAIQRHLDGVLPLTRIHAIGEGPRSERIERFVSSRLRLYEAIAPSARAARVAATRNAIIREQVELTRRQLGEQVERQFRPELEAMDAPRHRAIAGAVDTLGQFESLDHARVHRGLSRAATERELVLAIDQLLAPPVDAR